MAEVGTAQESVLSSDLHVKGSVSFEKALRVHGQVEGSISGPGRVHIAREGKVTGNIEAAEVVIEGDVNGDITATDRVELKSSSHYEGDLRSAKLAIDAGAFFTGHVTVGVDAAKDRAGKPGVGPKPAGGAAGKNAEHPAVR